MKKTILILAIMGMVFSSCSSDGDGNLEPNSQNLEGIWYIKEVIKQGDIIEPYINLCSNKRDYVNFDYPGYDYYSHYANCESFLRESVNEYYITSEDNRIVTPGYLFSDARITQLTSKRMKLEFDAPESYPYVNNNFTTVIGIILSKE